MRGSNNGYNSSESRDQLSSSVETRRDIVVGVLLWRCRLLYMACVFFVPKVQRGRARRGNRKYVGISMRAVSPVVYGSLGSAL